MKSYPQYKDSGIQWLDKIPAHWSLERNKTFFTEMKEEVGTNSHMFTLLSLTKRGIIPRDVTSGKGKFPESFDKYKVVKPGYMAFCLFDIDETPRTVGLSQYEGMLTGAYTILSVKGINPRYACYYYISLDNVKALRPLYTGLRKTINVNTFLGTKMPVPTAEEQQKIVAFLDWKMAGINKLLSDEHKKVASYTELRKAIIDEAILHGFEAEKKVDSGVFWLGEIPSSWEVKALKRICKVNASVSTLVNQMNDDEQVTFLPMENVSDTGEIDCSIKRSISEVKTGFSSFAKGDVVIAKITPCFENGKGACLDELESAIGFGTTELINLRPSKDILSRYLYMITMTRPFRVLGEEVMTGSAGQKRIPISYIKNFAVGIPPLDSQKRILETLDGKLKELDRVIEAEKKQISLLQELKESIISAVVTGKIDVRDIEIPEYEFVDDLDEDDNTEEQED